MMGIFRHRESAGWYRSIKTTAADKHPVTIVTIGQAPQPNVNFPWDKLQEHTDAYLRKKKKLTPEQLEARLVDFIKEHADRMDIAIAACGHKLRPNTLKGLLVSHLNIGLGKVLSLSIYLQAIVAANRVNPLSVSDAEAQRAHSMLSVSTIGATSPGNYLHELFKVIMEGIPPTFLLYTHIQALALESCMEFAKQLQTLRDEGRLQRAYTAAAWLSEISQATSQLAPDYLHPEQLLDDAFPMWKYWARWKPNQARLLRWDRFTNEERVSLRDLLILEGPDLVARQATLREGLLTGGLPLSMSPVRLGLQLEQQLTINLRLTIDRLMNSVDAASIASPNEIALLIYQCTGKVITHDALTVLELVRSIGDASITSLLMAVYAANKEPRSAQMTAAMRLLPLLARDQCQPLRECITPHLATLITGSIKDMQECLRIQLESVNTLDYLEINLQEFGGGLLDNPWITPFLAEDLLTLLNDWPTRDEIVSLHKLQIYVQTITEELKGPLTKKINGFCADCLIKRGTVDKPTKRLVEALISVWDETPSADLHAVAVLIAQAPDFKNKLRYRCLSLLSTFSADVLAELLPIMQNWGRDPDSTCVGLAKLLAPMSPSTSDAAAYWRLALYGMLQTRGQRLVANTLNHMKPVEWIKFLSDLRAACGGIEPQDPPPSIMAPDLQSWGQCMEKYAATLTGLEKDLKGCEPVMHYLLMGAEGNIIDHLDNILMYFTEISQDPNGTYRKPVMLGVIKLLTHENTTEVASVLSTLRSASKEGTDACLRVLDLHQEKTTRLVAEAILASSFQSSDMSHFDQSSLKAVAKMLGMNVRLDSRTPVASLEVAADYLEADFAKLFAEAQRLEGLRAIFKREDRDGISKLLSHLNIEDPSPMEDYLAKLPHSLVGAVEAVSDDEVELQFPLKFTPIQQIAMGGGKSQNLILRLFLTDYSKPPSFCLHLDDEKGTNATVEVHTPWDPSQSYAIPDHHSCYGRPNRTTYQLFRVLSRHLHSGFKSLEEIHKLVTTALEDLTTTCLICGTPRSTRLRRSATCQPSCSAIFLRASLDIRLAELRHDPPVVDLLLTMVHYAAASRKLELLPGCPFSDTLTVATIINKIPNLSKLANVDDLISAVKKLGAAAENLLSWACLNYRGCIVSASGKARIPGWPANTHQFLMANAAPDLEAAFRAQIGSLPTRVLWHGTSMERLLAIMTEGLKVCSNTPLQVHGAASGPGIYTADNPQTSWGYSSNAGANWSGSSFSNYRVLLGLEAAGPAAATGIHIVTDPRTLVVRYIFLVPSTATIPAATIVAPAMQSVYNSLRAGAI